MSLIVVAKDIKLKHSIFALPFACAGLYLAGTNLPTSWQIILLITCMVFARTFAMSMNRIIDWKIDHSNPRTKSRAIPSGRISPITYNFWAGGAGILFVICSFALNPKAGWLSVPLLFVLLGYSFMKRFTWLTHWYLGFCLGLAPIAAVIALNGQLNISLFLLCGAIAFWTAGFDILYSLQDQDFDKSQKLQSVPAVFGLNRALNLSRFCFAIMVISLTAIGFIEERGFVYFLGVAVIACFLFYEHVLIRNYGSSRNSKTLNAAFFTMNAYVSVFYLLCLHADFVIYGFKG